MVQSAGVEGKHSLLFARISGEELSSSLSLSQQLCHPLVLRRFKNFGTCASWRQHTWQDACLLYLCPGLLHTRSGQGRHHIEPPGATTNWNFWSLVFGLVSVACFAAQAALYVPHDLGGGEIWREPSPPNVFSRRGPDGEGHQGGTVLPPSNGGVAFFAAGASAMEAPMATATGSADLAACN